MINDRLRFGIFLAPFHALNENPTNALDRDFELIEHLDRLGYDEAWIGEHHSGGFEIIASPEVFMAAAFERTKNIRIGTGVVSLPYHHPFMAVDRMIQLDHQSKGRAMFGVGPGALVGDAFRMGIDPSTQRDRMNDEDDECEGDGPKPVADGPFLLEPSEGTPYCNRRWLGFVSPSGIPCTPPPWGTLAGIDLKTGNVDWQVPLGTTRDMAPWPFWYIKGSPNLGGPVSTASGLTFIGSHSVA